jgi:hypothetical protein
MRYVKKETNRYGAPARAKYRLLRDRLMSDARATETLRSASVKAARQVNWMIVRSLRG